MKKDTKQDITSLLINKKWYSDYEVLKEYECSIKLNWYEVKSIRWKHMHMKSSFITIRDNELFIQKLHISPYKQLTNIATYEAEAERKLFLHKKDIEHLSQKIKEKWYTIIPTEIYFKWNLVKIKIWLAKWRKEYEKKDILKKKDIEMDIRKSLKEI